MSSTLLVYAMIIVTELFLCCARERERVREGGGREGFFFWVKHCASSLPSLQVD